MSWTDINRWEVPHKREHLQQAYQRDEAASKAAIEAIKRRVAEGGDGPDPFAAIRSEFDPSGHALRGFNILYNPVLPVHLGDKSLWAASTPWSNSGKTRAIYTTGRDTTAAYSSRRSRSSQLPLAFDHLSLRQFNEALQPGFRSHCVQELLRVIELTQCDVNTDQTKRKHRVPAATVVLNPEARQERAKGLDVLLGEENEAVGREKCLVAVRSPECLLDCS